MQLRRIHWGCCCLPIVLFACMGIFLGSYLLWPGRINVLVMGLDYADPWHSIARTDTLIMTTFLPSKPYVGMLSVPRDLWVYIPGVGENRINTAHFFAEARQAGSGPIATIEAVRSNFGLDFDYYVRVRFEGFRDIINAMGGVDITLTEPMAGYEAGTHHLNGNKALAFARSRYGSDDFFRMEHAQLLVRSAFKQMLSPKKWLRLPAVLVAMKRSTDTNLPMWLLPRLAFTLLRVGSSGIDSRQIDRQMTTPYTTADGADVLLPNWELINPTLQEIFAGP